MPSGLKSGLPPVLSDGGEVKGPLSGVPLMKIMVPPDNPWANHFPKAPPSSITTLWDRISTGVCGETKHSAYSRNHMV